MLFTIEQKLIDILKRKNKRLYKVGQNTKIMEPSYIDKNCEIGKYTYIGTYSNITKAKIGNYCSIGNFVTIGPGEHKQNRISTSGFFAESDNYEELTLEDCTIGNDVWIGVGAIIKRGVHVGNGAIIGANSFVNKNVPDFAVVGGSPARIIRYRFNAEKISEITKSQWWNYDLQKAKTLIFGVLANSGGGGGKTLLQTAF